MKRIYSVSHRGRQDQLTISLGQEVACSSQQEQFQALSQLREPITQAMQIVHYDAYELTSEHCDVIATIFGTLQQAIQICHSHFEDPVFTAATRPYAVMTKLALLHRMVIEAQVLVKSVRGQCQYGDLMRDPTACYWHLRMCIRDIVAKYQMVLNQLQMELNSISHSRQSATAS